MFLLALLQMDMLVNQTSARKLNKALETLPQKLNKTFGNAIERATSQLAETSILAKCVISWSFFAKRPLQTSELREALAVESGDTCLDLSGLHEVELLLSIYCGLVSIDEQDGTIRLVYYSLQQYLDACWEAQWPDAEKTVATNCLDYLALNDFRPALRNRTQVADRLHTYSFLYYASCYWPEHIRGQFESELEHEIPRFLNRNFHLANANFIYFQTKQRDLGQWNSLPLATTPLHVATFWGLDHLLKVLLNAGSNINGRDFDKCTPLINAVVGEKAYNSAFAPGPWS